MKRAEIDSIIDNLFKFLPMVHRKLLRPALERSSMSRLHLVVMGVLQESGALPVSEVAKRLLISRPQMTSLTDGLIKMGLIERIPDPSDRRVVKVALTGLGSKDLAKSKAKVRRSLRKKLSSLDKGDVESISASLTTLVEIVSQLD